MTPVENTAMGAPEEGAFLTVAECAAFLRCESATIYAAIANDEIDGVIRIGVRRGYRVPRASFRKYVAGLAIRQAPTTDTAQLATAGQAA